MIEPVTGCDTSALGESELDSLIDFHKKRLDSESLSDREEETSTEILVTLSKQKKWRNQLKAVNCPWLTQAGFCRHALVTARHGDEYSCPRLNNSGCTLKRMQFATKISKQS